MSGQNKAIAIYSRKSKFTGKGESIENQIELCRQYIKAHYGSLALKETMVYEDEGFSGGNLDRPEFKKMIQDGKNQKLSMIVCYRLDRISRNIGDFAKLIEELNELNISFISIKEQFDTSSPMGRAMMYIASVFSQLERETIAERIRDNMHELSKTGRWLGGITPTGYRSENVESIKIDGKIKKACKLEIIPAEAKVVQLIFDKFLETTSLSKTETFLMQREYRSKNGKLYSRFSIKGILSNPVYMISDKSAYEYWTNTGADLFSSEADFDGVHGIMAYNRTIQKPGKTHKIRPVEEWIVSVGMHPGIISSKDWITVQEILKQNRSKNYRKPRSHRALLSGILYCAHCKDYMRPKLSQRLNPQGEPVFSYLCNIKEKSRLVLCDMKNANGTLLDQEVLTEIKKLPINQHIFLKQLEENKKTFLLRIDDDNGMRDKLSDAMAVNESDITKLAGSLVKASGSAAEQYILTQIEDLHYKNEALKKQQQDLFSSMGRQSLSDMELEGLKNQLLSFPDAMDLASIEKKRWAARLLIEKVLWDGENAHIYFHGALDENVEKTKST